MNEWTRKKCANSESEKSDDLAALSELRDSTVLHSILYLGLPSVELMRREIDAYLREEASIVLCGSSDG